MRTPTPTNSRVLRMPWPRSLLVLALCLAMAGPGSAQTSEEILPLLASEESADRYAALVWLGDRDPEEWPGGAADRVVELLNTEAAADPALDEEDHAYGEYLLELVLVALVLEDPRSLYGMAHLGIEVGGGPMRFVAGAGDQALPILDDVWEEKPRRQSVVTEVWGIMLRSFSDQLTPDAERVVHQRILRAATTPNADVGFLIVARRVPLPELLPLVEELAASTPHEIVRSRAERIVIPELRAMRDEYSTRELHGRLAKWLDAICVDAAGPRRGACQSLGNQLATAGRHLEAGRSAPARNVLEAFARRADQAASQGTLTEMEHQLLVENARYLQERL